MLLRLSLPGIWLFKASVNGLYRRFGSAGAAGLISCAAFGDASFCGVKTTSVGSVLTSSDDIDATGLTACSLGGRMRCTAPCDSILVTLAASEI